METIRRKEKKNLARQTLGIAGRREESGKWRDEMGKGKKAARTVSGVIPKNQTVA